MQTIYLDISNKGVYPCIYAKQSEVGRKFLAVITDGGVPYNIPENSLLSVWYEGDTDAGNYSSIEEKSAFTIDGNKVTVELVAQMLLKPGNGELCLSVTHGDGGETNTWNIPYCVEYKPGAGSSVPTEYYTALTEAGALAAESAAVAKEQAEVAKQQADLAGDAVENAIKYVPDPTDDSNAANKAYVDQGLMGRLPAVESTEHPGCYYRIVDGEKAWINPPMVIGAEYLTNERYNAKPVYVKTVDIGALPNNAFADAGGWGSQGRFTPIRCTGCAYVPQTEPSACAIPMKLEYTEVSVSVSSWGIFVKTVGDWSAQKATVTIWYIKN